MISLGAGEFVDLAVRWQQPRNRPLQVPCNNPFDIQQTRKNSHVPPWCWHCKSRSASPELFYDRHSFCFGFWFDFVQQKLKINNFVLWQEKNKKKNMKKEKRFRDWKLLTSITGAIFLDWLSEQESHKAERNVFIVCVVFFAAFVLWVSKAKLQRRAKVFFCCCLSLLRESEFACAHFEWFFFCWSTMGHQLFDRPNVVCAKFVRFIFVQFLFASFFLFHSKAECR